MMNTINSTIADALMDFALYIYAQGYETDGRSLDEVREEALEFAREMFKGYCESNGIEYVTQS